jgi:hypothetical protein
MTKMITKEDARRLVIARINEPDPMWPDRPEFIVTSVEEHRLGWLISYDSRPHQETGDFQHAIVGNAPYLVSSVDGSLHVTGTAPSFAERLREAEGCLERHLAEITQAEQAGTSNGG